MVDKSLAIGVRDFTRGLKLRHVWGFLAWQDVFAKYRRSILGPFWVAGGTVASAIALSFVFGGLFRQPLSETMPYIMGGLIIWNWVGMPLNDGPEVFASSAGIIKNHAYPFSLYIFRLITRNLIVFAHVFVVYVAILFMVGGYRGFHWHVIPGFMLVVAYAAIYSGLSGMLAARYRDLRFLAPFLAQMLFFITPIFWRAEAIQDERALVYLYNPFYHLLSVVRQPLLGLPASNQSWEWSLTIVAVGAVVWLVAFSRFRHRIAFWV